jgi:hypothetical protein
MSNFDLATDNLWQLPWGDSRVDLSPPTGLVRHSGQFLPDLAGAFSSHEQYAAELNAALDFPQDQPRLENRIGPGTRVAIVVDDPSRWSPLRQCLPIVLGRLLQSGVDRSHISISFGVGRHAAVTAADMRQKLGDEIVQAYACHSPPVDDLSAYEELGISADGVPVRVFSPVAKADLRILVGSVLPHLQAGFGGGWKLIFPGCSHRTTLGAIHQQGLDGNAAALLGTSPNENPMRQAISRAAKLLPGGTISISHVIGRNSNEIFAVSAGEPDMVALKNASEARRRFRWPGISQGALPELVIVGNSPWPGDPMHSFKTLLNHRSACKPGGVLAGVFWTDPAELGRSFPVGAARSIARSGRAGALATRFGLPLAEKIATWSGSSKRFMMRWARELVLDRTVIVYSPEMQQMFGSRLGSVFIAGSCDEFWKLIKKNYRNEIESVMVFPYGGLSYAESGF